MNRCIWLIQAAELLPIDSGARIMRTGLLAECFASLGYEVVWFSARFDHSNKLQRPGPLERKYTTNCTLVLLDGMSYSKNVSLRRFLNHRQTAKHFRNVALNYRRPDLILISYPSPELALAAAEYAITNHVPYVLDYRDAWPDILTSYLPPSLRMIAEPLVARYRRQLRKILFSAKGLFAPSKNMLMCALNYLPDKRRDLLCEVRYLGYPASRDSDILSGEFSARAPLTISYVGSLGSSYNIELIVNLAHHLAGIDERRVRFIVMGDGDRKGHWERMAAGLKNIVFTGWRPISEVEKVLSRSHIGVALYDGATGEYTFPNKIAEYFSYNLPIITNLRSEAGDFIQRNDIGIFVEGSDFIECLRWILSMVGDPVQLEAMQMRVQKVFNEYFRADRIYPRMVRSIENCCGLTDTTHRAAGIS